MNDENKLIAALCYVLAPWVSLFILFTDKKNDPSLKFHAIQSLFLCGVIILTSWLLVGIVAWIYSLFYAFKLYTTGEEMTIPMLTDMARKQTEK